MSERPVRIVTKRTSVPGKIPTGTTGTELNFIKPGELASNLADKKLYSYDGSDVFEFGSNSFLSLTGGTISGNLDVTGSISATTYYNLPTLSGNYLPLSGGTVYGDTVFSSGLTASTLTVTGLTQTKGVTSTGGITFKQVTINSTYSATTEDYMIDVSGGTFTVYLPSAIGIQGRLLVVKNNGGGAVTVQPTLGQNIDDKPFVILGETNTIQLASNGSNWIAISYNISTVNSSTGVFEFSGLTTASTTTFTVAPVKGWIVDDTTNPLSPQLYYVDYSGGTHTANYVTTDTETWVYLTSGGTISQLNIPLTEQQRRQNIFLGKLSHPSKTNIVNAFSQPDFVLSPLSQLRDMFTPINLINGGIRTSANGANLSFNTSASYLYGLGINFANDTLNPDRIYVSGTSPCTFQYRTQTGGTTTNVTVIDPTKYDVGGVVTSLTGTKATNQRIYLLQNGDVRVQYGQVFYSTLAQAVVGISTEQFVEFSNFTANGILIGILSVLSTATDLTDTTKALFFNVSKFGDASGAAGGTPTTTLQQAYSNSVSPEIITNSILDGVQIRSGTGNDSDKNLIIENNAGTQTAWINASGDSRFNSVSANTVYTDYVDFNTTYTGATTQGRISWDSGTGTLNVGVGDPGGTLIDLQVGQEEVVRVYNAEATTLTKGELVYVSGSQGNRPSVKRAIATNDGYSVTTLGMVDANITSGSEGYVTTFGIISNLNTLGLTGGTPIWLSPTVAGGYTSTKPKAPNHTVLIGYVVRVSATVGSIFINISNGWELDEIHDVRINGVTSGDLLMRSSYSGSPVWVNTKTLIGSGYTIGGNLTVTGSTNLNTLTANTIGTSGNCVNDVYVSNIHSCSPLNINPLNEGNVYFGSTSGITIDLTNKRLGIGTSSPVTPLHIAGSGGTVNPALYTTDYLTISAQNTAPGFNIIAASNTSGHRGVFKATRSRGTLDSPTVPQNNDSTFSLLGAIYDGVTNFSTAAIAMEVDGTVSANTAPQRIIFSTGSGSTRAERMRIDANGNVGINNTPSSSTGTFSVKATAIPSSNETIASFLVSDASSSLTIQNASTINNVFVPTVVGTQPTGQNQIALMNATFINSADDTGTNPNMVFRVSTNSLATIATRPLFDFRNWSTSVMLIAANGNVGIGTTTPTAKLHINNVTSGNTLLVEDSTNPDFSPFVIDNSGNVAIGKTSVTSGTKMDLEVDGKTIGINIGNSNTSFMAGTGIFSYGTGVGIEGIGRNDFGTVVGIKGQSIYDISADPSTKYYGGEFIAAGLAGGDYSVRLADGTEGIGKFLYSVDTNGSANWTSDLSGTSATISGTLSATTLYGNGSNLTGVGGGKGSFGITIDGGGSAITTGQKGYVTIPYNCTITGWDIFSDQTGSIVVDVWKDTYANFPPTSGDTITGTEKPTLSSARKNQDTNLTSWTTSITTGDIIAFNVDSASSVTRVNLIIYVNKL